LPAARRQRNRLRFTCLCWALVGFVLLFPVRVARRFYALELPRSGLAIILLIAAAGAAALVSLWAALRRRQRGR